MKISKLNINLRRLLALCLLLMAVTSVSFHSTTVVSAQDADCEIPESGPWPPCATGGNTGDDGCVIPPSGPWPDCATGGGSGSGGGSSDGCVIPPSGPWPDCATGGSTPPPPGLDDGCVIPPSGPWPDCATGGSGGGTTPPPAPNPTPEPPAPTPVPDDGPPPDPEPITFITVYYVSNPDDIIGVFPVVFFDAEVLYYRMLLNQDQLNIMRNNLNGALDGDQASCDRYEDAYEEIKDKGLFFIDIPGDWVNLDLVYFNSFIFALDRTRPAYLSCFDSGRVDNFNYGLAFTAIEDALNILNPAVEEAAAKLGK